MFGGPLIPLRSCNWDLALRLPPDLFPKFLPSNVSPTPPGDASDTFLQSGSGVPSLISGGRNLFCWGGQTDSGAEGTQGSIASYGTGFPGACPYPLPTPQ